MSGLSGDFRFGFWHNTRGSNDGFCCGFFIILDRMCDVSPWPTRFWVWYHIVFCLEEMLQGKMMHQKHSWTWGLRKRKEKKRNFLFILVVLVACLSSLCMLVSNAGGPHSSLWILRLAILTITRFKINPNYTPSPHSAVSLTTLMDIVQRNCYRISQTQTHAMCKMKDATWSRTALTDVSRPAYRGTDVV